jgi:cysteine desulfurase
MKPIYLDNCASTALAPAAWDAMRPYWMDQPGNPASSHQYGRRARQGLENAREQIAALLDAQPDEVLFTSGATEANNLAVFGIADSRHPGRVLTSQLEHPSVVEPIRRLVQRGFTVEDLPVADDGRIQVPPNLDLSNVRLIAVQLANHETGAVQPMSFPPGHTFHCDAAAAAGKMAISFRQLPARTLTVSAHKFHGPKGIGALLVRKGFALRPLFFGGHQQHGIRPGTEPVALAVGMAEALRWSLDNLEAHRAHLGELRRRFLAHLEEHAAPVVLNGPADGGVPGTLNLSFPGCQADALLMSLDLAGVACSTGSACSSGSLLPSPVLLAMHRFGEVLNSAMRFSFSPLNTVDEVDEAARRIVQCVNRLRREGRDAD